MAIKVQFIDTEFLKENTLIEQNVDDAKLNPLIFKAQEIHIETILGSDFYNHLMDAAYNDTLTQDEKDLIANYIQQCVAEWVAYMSVNQLTNKFTNKAIVQEFSQYSATSDRLERTDLKNDLRNDAEVYSKRLITHLCQYSELYPLYYNPNTNENVRRNSTSFFNNIYIPRNTSCGCDSSSQYRND